MQDPSLEEKIANAKDAMTSADVPLSLAVKSKKTEKKGGD